MDEAPPMKVFRRGAYAQQHDSMEERKRKFFWEVFDKGLCAQQHDSTVPKKNVC